MAKVAIILLLAISMVTVEGVRGKKTSHVQDREIYTASWAVEIRVGGKKTADSIATKHCFRNMGKIQIGSAKEMYHFELCDNEKRSMRTDSPDMTKKEHLILEPEVGIVEQQVIRPRVLKSYVVPTDPLFSTQWNVLNSGQFAEQFRGNDLNVEPAWIQGYSGCNVTVAVVDDGLDVTHDDLWDNFVPQVAFDFIQNDQDPSSNNPSHGTSVGGIIGSVKDNDVCGVGIAYEVNLGGLALLGAGTDMNEATSLTFENEIVDVYSNSWGPFDDGSTVSGPGTLTNIALQTGTSQGRGGKGSIYVWANGNGGANDDCAADGYTLSPYTISVGALGVDGFPSPFDEECSAKLVTAYVTNPSGNSAVTSTAVGGGCTLSFGGTSAATPMVSGVIALTLEANPELTWRDVQYLIVYTSNTEATNATDSVTNGAGLSVSHQVGFGVIDAEAMVTRATRWTNVPSLMIEQNTPTITSGTALYQSPFTTTLQYNGSLHYLEHIVIDMTVNTQIGTRRDMRIELTSPYGTRSTLLSHRNNDFSSSGYFSWPFMSVMFWGEDPTGEWNLTIITRSTFTNIAVSGVTFQFFGVSSTPESVANIPATCHSDCRRGCAGMGSGYCDACVNLRNAYTLECIDTCPVGYTERNGYCYNQTLPTDECFSPLKEKEGGSCVNAGFSGCCVGDNCLVLSQSTFSTSCFCDVLCYTYDDCCDDISSIGCTPGNDTVADVVIPYITLGVTQGVITQSVPSFDDGTSSPIFVPFPLGSQFQSTVYVGTNGYFTFTGFSGYSSFLFNEDTTLPLVAPFFTDIDISNGVGEIDYEIHTAATSGAIFSQVNSLIEEHAETNFSGEWMLVATWDDVPPFGSGTAIRNTFQGILVTNFSSSFAIFTYQCGDLEYSNGATIGFSSGDGLFANHPATTRGSAQSIACLNQPVTPWVNVVYEITIPGGVDENSTITPTLTPTSSPTTSPTTPPSGSCVAAGFVGCCTSGCSVGSCWCDQICYVFNDCCDDIQDIGCFPVDGGSDSGSGSGSGVGPTTPPPTSPTTGPTTTPTTGPTPTPTTGPTTGPTADPTGSCLSAGFAGCCEDSSCAVVSHNGSCFCDQLCYNFADCCGDIAATECYPLNIGQVIPYITFGETEGVFTQAVPDFDDGISAPINISFPLGSHVESTVYVGTNGYFTFIGFTGYTPFLFNENTTLPLVAPFFTDIDISNGVGEIDYEIHTAATSQSILSQVNSLINEQAETNFNGEWMLVATWDQVPRFGAGTSNTNMFQGMLVTDFTRSFAVFTYFCTQLEHSDGATVGFSSGDGLFANHPASLRGLARSIACLNQPVSPWVNVVYELTSPGVVCSEGYYYSSIAEECISLDPDEVHLYESTVLEGCDPDRNAEYRAHIEAEVQALIHEYFENAP